MEGITTNWTPEDLHYYNEVVQPKLNQEIIRILSMNYYISKVKEFHDAFDFTRPNCFMNAEKRIAHLRYNLITEEYRELSSAQTKLETLDALCDLQYVTAGTFDQLAVSQDFPKTPKMNLPTAVGRAIQELNKSSLCQEGLQNSLGDILMNVELSARSVTGNFIGAFNEVHRSNMAKLWTWDEAHEHAARDKAITIVACSRGPAGKVFVKRQDGKLIKPPSWTPPNLEQFLLPG